MGSPFSKQTNARKKPHVTDVEVTGVESTRPSRIPSWVKIGRSRLSKSLAFEIRNIDCDNLSPGVTWLLIDIRP